MDRRTFVRAIGTALAPIAARAQQSGTVRRIGVLSPFVPADAARWHEAFRQGLRERGWIEGKDISIEYRYADGHMDRLPALATELVRLKVDVIVTSVMDDTLPAKEATQSIPIVMAAGIDPVLMGMAGSLARPGGNVTGLARGTTQLAGTRLGQAQGKGS